jgi:hypothetical protein
VGQLDHAGSGQHSVGGGPAAGLRCEQHEQRPEALAAGVEEVARCLGDERCLTAHVVAQRRLDVAQPGAQPGLEAGVEDRKGQRAAHSGPPGRREHSGRLRGVRII